ncbi:MAG: hypothetical protein JWM74_475 [Myxococcaceae bacterium]|nr:hypothetical protein [Myxococcaceae bacterium]
MTKVDAKLLTSEDAYVELSFSPNVKLVPTVRRFVEEFYQQMLRDQDGTSRLAMATHELLENAVRYSIDGNTRVRVGLRREGAGGYITIETFNLATPENAVAVRTIVDEVASAPDAMIVYQTLMRRTAKRTDGSGLGLGRIRAEGEMVVSCEVLGQLVCLKAEAHFPELPR